MAFLLRIIGLRWLMAAGFAGLVITSAGQTTNCDCWIAPDATYTLAMPPNDDGSSAVIPLPFQFNLYGTLYNDVYINNNGNVSFDAPNGTFTATGFPTGGVVMVAPFWGDVDTQGIGQVWYKVTPTAMYVNWVDVGYFSSQVDKTNTFQLIITDGTDPILSTGNNVSFCYQDMQWTTGSASGGTGGFGGSPAVVGANEGNGVDYIQFGAFDQPGAAYDGPFNLNDGVDWLDNKNFVFTTSTTSTNIAPIGSSLFLCDTIDACVGQTVQIPFDFLAPEPTQTVTANSFSTGLSNYFEFSNNSPSIAANVVGQFTPLASEAGFQLITFTGTDNGAPPLQSTYEIVVQVFPSPPPGSTTNLQVCPGAGPMVDLFPSLAGPPPLGGNWADPNGNIHSGMFDPALDPVGVYTYSYAISGGLTCPATESVNVSFFPVPTAGSNGTAYVCSSGITISLIDSLNGSPAAGGTWTDPLGNVVTGSFNSLTDPLGLYTYTVVGAGGCPGSSATVDVDVQIPPDAGTNGAVTFCSTDPSASLFNSIGGSPQAGGNWLDPFGGFSTGQFNPQFSPIGIYQYIVPGSSFCSADTAEVLASVVTAPVGGTLTNLDFCSTDPITDLFPLISGFPNAGGTWSDPLGNAFSGLLDPSVGLSGAYIYTLIGSAPCADVLTTVNVSIQQLPDAGVDGSLSMCEDEPVIDLFTLLGGTPLATGFWLDPAGNPFSGQFDPAVNANGDYTYIVPGTVICPSDTSTVSMVVDILPVAGADAVLAVCEDATTTDLFTLLGAADPGGTWTVSGNAFSGTVNPAVDSTGVYVYQVAGTGACATRIDEAQVDVTISPLPIVQFTVDSVESCTPFPVNFTNLTDPFFLDGTCSWDFGDGGSSSDCASTTNTYQNPGTYDVGLTITTAAGCTDTQVQTSLITAYPPPTASFAMGPNPTSVEDQQITFGATDPLAVDWTWTIPTLGQVTGTSVVEHTFDSFFGEEFEICLEVSDQFGCLDTECQTLLINGPLWVYVPNAFTPNGDGINDAFFPVIDGDDGEIHDFVVYDRWGTPVFESSDKTIPWLGSKNNSGDLLPIGVYVWRLVTRGWGQTETKEYFGHVSLIR